MKKLKPLNDVVFKKLFGENHDKELLIQFLNALLESDITDLTIREEKLTREKIDDKQGILDIKAELVDGEKVDIEVQLLNQYNMIPRTLFYWSRLFTENFQKRGVYSDLRKTIVINILGFDLINGVPYHSHYHLYEDQTQVKLTDLLEIHFIEYPKFKAIESQLNNPLHRWLLFLSGDASESIMKEVVAMDQMIKRADEKLTFLSADEEIRRMAELREKGNADRISRDEYVRDTAKFETARRLHAMGMSIEDISHATQIPVVKLKEFLESSPSY